MVCPTDVADLGQVEALVARVGAELGPVGAVVNCAGVLYYTLTKNVRADGWDRTVGVNRKGR